MTPASNDAGLASTASPPAPSHPPTPSPEPTSPGRPAACAPIGAPLITSSQTGPTKRWLLGCDQALIESREAATGREPGPTCPQGVVPGGDVHQTDGTMMPGPPLHPNTLEPGAPLARQPGLHASVLRTHRSWPILSRLDGQGVVESRGVRMKGARHHSIRCSGVQQEPTADLCEAASRNEVGSDMR